ncbi:MAG: aminotransferase class V-fold PLP-dependent enzyme [Actinomycetia bacterium]|jgi:kynureninase|nr:aminotransferase class V-fold PLP-dependent enzyme [Actinomycetes bacterium]
MHEDLLRFREDYPILASSVYLVNNSLGAVHRRTAERLQQFYGEWAAEGVVAWEHWVPEMQRIADLVGRIIGAPPGTTLIRQDVASIMGAVASCVDWSGPRNRVVYSDLEWPSSHYLWQEHRRLGADVVVVPSAGDGVHLDVERLVDAIDERTALVPISLVLFRSSTLVDVRPVVARAHEVGAWVLLDAYQAAGVVPVDVVRLDADFCVGGSVKYLCGGPGAAWVYVRPDLAETLRPTQVGWFGHERPFDFAFEPLRPAPGVLRFSGGTHNVPSAYAASAGYEGVLAAGVDRIRERSQALTQPLLEGALERGFVVRSPRDAAQRGGHVTIDPGRSREVHDELLRRRFVVDHRPGSGIRVGPHFFNTADEVAALLEETSVIRAGLGSGSG